MDLIKVNDCSVELLILLLDVCYQLKLFKDFKYLVAVDTLIQKEGSTMDITYEKQLPVAGVWDVLVCGAGPTGIAAAVTAARQGQKTLVLERYGAVGGNLTLGNVSPIMGSVAPGTIAFEIGRLLKAIDGGTAIDPENAKIQLTQLLHHEGVTFRLQTPVVDVIKEKECVVGVVIATQQGLQIILGKRIIDCTGDGLVAALAGATVMMGRESDGHVQPMSLMYIIEGVDPKIDLVCRHETDYSIMDDGREYLALCEQAATDGRLPENVMIVRLYPTNIPGERLVNATQQNGLNPLDSKDLEMAEINLRAQITQINQFLRAEIKGFAKIFTRISAATMGIRETRRILGIYTITDEDVLLGRTFRDVMVHKAGFCFDIHNPTGGGQAEEIALCRSAKAHDIPMRSMQPEGLDGLIVAGRCISGTHRAHSSYRVMNICMSMGQAAGMMAVSSIENQVTVADINVQDVQHRLIVAGCQLFD